MVYPAAQFPEAVPPLFEHSDDVKQVPLRKVLNEKLIIKKFVVNFETYKSLLSKRTLASTSTVLK